MQKRAIEKSKDSFGKLWYQRYKFDNRLVSIVFTGHIIVIFLSYRILTNMPWSFYVSIEAFINYILLIMTVLFIYYPSRMIRKLNETFNLLESEEILSKNKAEEAIVKTYEYIHGWKEKYVPLLIAGIVIATLIYDGIRLGVFDSLYYTDFDGTRIVLTIYPITTVFQWLFQLRTFLQCTLAFSTLIIAVGISRSINYIADDVKISVVSPERVGGLLSVGRLITELTLVIMTLPTIMGFLGVAFYMISGIFSNAILLVVALGYIFLLVMLLPPLLAIHRVMLTRKREALAQLSSQIEKKRLKLQRDDINIRQETLGLSSSLLMLDEIRKMRTVPFDYVLLRRISILIVSPLLSCISVVIEEQLGHSAGPISLGIIVILSLLPHIFVD